MPSTLPATTTATPVPATSPASAPATAPTTVSAPATAPAPPPSEGGPSLPEAGPREERLERADRTPHPEFVPAEANWPLRVIGGIAALFLSAALIGPLVRALAPTEVPPAQSHDEPPGASGRHGKSGTLNPE